MPIHFDKKNLHHAYCIVGNNESILIDVQQFLRKELGFIVEGNPDFWYGEYDVLDTEDGRTIKNLHGNKPTTGDKKIFVVNANFITEKAQNAMLKLFEEPRGDTHFFLVLPSLNNIIPTFRSRLFIIDTSGTNDSLINPAEFLHMPVGERIKAVKGICDSITDEEKSKIEVTRFINALETELVKNTDFVQAKKDELNIFEEIERVRQYAGEQSPSLKMLLEHLALIIPIKK